MKLRGARYNDVPCVNDPASVRCVDPYLAADHVGQFVIGAGPKTFRGAARPGADAHDANRSLRNSFKIKVLERPQVIAST